MGSLVKQFKRTNYIWPWVRFVSTITTTFNVCLWIKLTSWTIEVDIKSCWQVHLASPGWDAAFEHHGSVCCQGQPREGNADSGLTDKCFLGLLFTFF